MLSLHRRATPMAVESVNSSKEPEHEQAALIEEVCECGALKIFFFFVDFLDLFNVIYLFFNN